MTDTTSAGGGESPPRVLLLYYSYTGQAQKVLEAAGEVFRSRGCEVNEAEIKFTDKRYSERFSRFPMRRVWPDMLSVLQAQKRNETGEIQTPDTVRNADYDLILIGSPTWWHTVSMPLRSFLKSDEARKLLSGKPFAVFVVCRSFGAKPRRRCANSPSSRAGDTSMKSISPIPATTFAPCWR